MEEVVRVRVEFEEHRLVLSKLQRRDGLKRSWLLLRPGLATVADLANHLSRCFRLQASCPRGLVLSMDGFVLPSFESTCIFKDKDIIRVRKRKGRSKFLENGDNEHCIHNSENARQHVSQGNKLLEIKNFPENSAEYSVEYEGEESILLEGAILAGTPFSDDKKRKKGQSNKLRSTKRKKLEQTSPENQTVSTEGAQNVHLEHNQSSRKSILKKNKTSNGEGRFNDTHIISQTDGAIGSGPKEDSYDKREENSQKNMHDLKVDGCTKKSPSRCARRKKAKRQWLREIRKSEINERQLTANNMQVTPGHPISDNAADVEDESVPFVVHPEHICFETTVAEQSDQQKKRGTLQWNGTTSKKEEQNCGMKNILVGNGCNGGSNGKCNSERRELLDNYINFENLYPLTRLPKEGDVIVYRTFVSSSPWGSELSTYRVGKVSAYDPLSMNVILMPVPEYPIFSSEKGGEVQPVLHPNTSLYKEDGSLEIEYPSLFDVRLFKINNSGEAIVNNWEVVLETNQNGFASVTESRPDRGWEQIDHKLDENEVQADGWQAWPKNNSVNKSWHDRVSSWTSTKLERINDRSNCPTRPIFTSSTWRGSRGRGRGFAVRGRRGGFACSKADLW